MNVKVDILLATYNGDKYIEEQLDSLINQTYTDWKLIVHDDGSKDRTVEIIKEYSSKYPSKIELIEDSIKTGGAKNNFSHLMNFSTSPYIMFCDQDDVWVKNKIEMFYKKIIESEKLYRGVPIVVFSDLIVVNEELQVVCKSMMKSQKLPFIIAESYELLKCQNIITGCAMMFNKQALLGSIPVPKDILMHDWWVSLVTAKKGKNIYLNEKTVLYRQHASNVVGHQRISVRYVLNKIFSRKIIIDFFEIKKMLSHIEPRKQLNYMEFVACKIKVIYFRFFYE